VDMPNQEQAEAAILALHGKPYKERPLTVNEARPRTEMSSGGGYGGRAATEEAQAKQRRRWRRQGRPEVLDRLRLISAGIMQRELPLLF
jgi:RNA recognition motif-containing protein